MAIFTFFPRLSWNLWHKVFPFRQLLMRKPNILTFLVCALCDKNKFLNCQSLPTKWSWLHKKSMNYYFLYFFNAEQQTNSWEKIVELVRGKLWIDMLVWMLERTNLFDLLLKNAKIKFNGFLKFKLKLLEKNSKWWNFLTSKFVFQINISIIEILRTN